MSGSITVEKLSRADLGRIFLIVDACDSKYFGYISAKAPVL